MDDGLTFATAAMYAGDSLTGPYGADGFGWFHDVLCNGVSDEMQFRFRFVSNETIVNRGWFVDNIELTGDAATIFGLDPALVFDNFYRHEHQYGCWWQQPWIEKYYSDLAWGGANRYYTPGDFASWEPSWGVYDPFIVYGPRPWVGVAPDNLDTALIWTLDIPKAFYGWFEVTTAYDMDPGDFGYIDISRDGVTWDNLATEQGSANDDYQGGALNLATIMWNDYMYWGGGSYSLADYMDEEQIQIRFRYTSDPVNLHVYGAWSLFDGPCFYGMNDNNPPVTIAQMTGTFDEECHWYTSAVKIKLTATDDISGVAVTYYELDGVQHEYTGLITINTDGTHTFCYWSVDNEGNVEEKKCFPDFRIDLTGPSVTITGPATGYLYLFGNQLFELKSGKTIFLFGGIPVTATATADDVPVAVVQFFLDDVLMNEDTTAPYAVTIKAKHTGAATIKVTAIDDLGRSASDTLNIDNYFKLF
jgi:hypothetical protein